MALKSQRRERGSAARTWPSRVRLGTAFALLLVLTVTAMPTGATAAGPDDCPDLEILDKAAVEALAAGTPLVGLTVEAGRTPSRIDFEVEHVQRGGLPDNAPFVIARATSGSPATKGIWFGMSGSPVFTLDGAGEPDALVGAVAFGVAWQGDSPLAGLQPAYAMEKVRGYAPASVTVSASAAEELADATGLPLQAVRRFEPLSVPLALSGARPQRLATVDRALDRAGLAVAPVAGSSTAVSGATASATLAPGDTFAAALSYGYLTAAGIGTTTYVCGDRAMAFGHPFFFSGPTEVGANAGRSAYVVEDKLGGAYKLARVAGVAGVVEQDRFAGLRAQLGRKPTLVPIRSTVVAPDIDQRGNATTQMVGQRHVPFLGWLHTLAHLDDTADLISEGSSRVAWTITGTTRNGVPFEVRRVNRFTSPWDITFESTFELFDALWQIQNNPFRKVQFTGVRLNAEVREEVLTYTVRDVRVWRNGAWRRVEHLRVRPGEVLQLQVRLRGGGGRTEEFQLRVPPRARGFGELVASRPDGDGDDDEFLEECLFGDCSDFEGGPSSFPELLESIATAPRNDVLGLRLTIFDFDEETGEEAFWERSRRRRVDRVVSGSVRIPVEVRG